MWCDIKDCDDCIYPDCILSEADKDEKISRYASGTLMAIWPSGKIGNAFSTRIDICIKCYVKHNSWKSTKTSDEG